MSGILVLGAGGHAKVVADILLSQGVEVAGFLDDDPQSWGLTRLGIQIRGPMDSFESYAPDGLIIGVGSNQARRLIAERLKQVDDLWRSALHPSCVIASSAQLGRGVVVAAAAVINPDSTIGDHAIINTGATVDHDCTIGEFVHLGPGVHLSGGVRVGSGALVGVGASLAPGCSVGEWAVVGAGSVVVRDIPAGVTAKGVPARW